LLRTKLILKEEFVRNAAIAILQNNKTLLYYKLANRHRLVANSYSGIVLEAKYETLVMKKQNANRSDRQADKENNSQQAGKDQTAQKGNMSRGGDTSRSSSQGRKESSGGSRETNNQGRPKE
jgi:hypothetical protein